GAGNSLLRISNSLFREKHSLIRTEQGISRRLFKSLCDFAPVSAKAVPNSLNFTEFPVIFPVLLRLIENSKIDLTTVLGSIRVGDMIRGGFLSTDERRALIELARDGLAEHRLARRANAIVLLDKGWSCAKVAGALLLDDDTVRGWFRAYEKEGVEGLRNFGHE